MNNDIYTEPQRTMELSVGAHASLRAFAKDPLLYSKLCNEMEEGYSDVFLAFLIVPGVANLPPNTLHAVFDDAFRVEGFDFPDAVDELIVHLEWREELAALKKDLGISGPLSWEQERLREAFEKRYEFVYTDDACYVFDREAIPLISGR